MWWTLTFPLIWGVKKMLDSDSGGSSSSSSSYTPPSYDSATEALRKQRNREKQQKQQHAHELINAFIRAHNISNALGKKHPPQKRLSDLRKKVEQKKKQLQPQKNKDLARWKECQAKLEQLKTITDSLELYEQLPIKIEPLKKKLKRLRHQKQKIPTIAVFGQMNGGKSALLNAIVGKKIFDVADRRCTTETKTHKKYGVQWMDTPGSDAHLSDEKAALLGLEKADAWFFVHSVAQGGLSEPEIQYLRLFFSKVMDKKNASKQLYIILTKADMGNEESIKHTIQTQLKQVFDIQPRAILATSSQRAEKAKEFSEPVKIQKLLEKSGIQKLRLELELLRKELPQLQKEQAQHQLELVLGELKAHIENHLETERNTDNQAQNQAKIEIDNLSNAFQLLTRQIGA